MCVLMNIVPQQLEMFAASQFAENLGGIDTGKIGDVHWIIEIIKVFFCWSNQYFNGRPLTRPSPNTPPFYRIANKFSSSSESYTQQQMLRAKTAVNTLTRAASLNITYCVP